MSPHWQGVLALSRALIKFERWDEILKEASIPWGDPLRDKLGRRYAEAMAHLGQEEPRSCAQGGGRPCGAPADVEKDANAIASSASSTCRISNCGVSLALLQGEAIDGITLLTQAAPNELEQRAYYDDPPFFATLMWARLGFAYLDQRSPTLAVDAFKRR